MSSSEVSKYIWVAFIVVSRFSDVWYQSLSQKACASAHVVPPVFYCQVSYPWSCNKRESIILRVLVITCNMINPMKRLHQKNHLCNQRNAFFLCDWVLKSYQWAAHRTRPRVHSQKQAHIVDFLSHKPTYKVLMQTWKIPQLAHQICCWEFSENVRKLVSLFTITSVQMRKFFLFFIYFHTFFY